MNIILTGLRGTGKTTLGKLLAEKLGKPFFDTDELIAEMTKRKPREIIEKDGWDEFRLREGEAVTTLAGETDAVIATGGGTLMYERNLEILKKQGFIVLCTAPIPLMLKRTIHDNSRPALTKYKNSEDEITAVWNERKERYERIADVQFSVEDVSAEENLAQLIKLLNRATHDCC